MTGTKPQSKIDRRIDTLQLEARRLQPKIEKIVAELKALGPHSVNGDAALQDTQTWLKALSRR